MLTNRKMNEIIALKEICEGKDGYNLKLNLEMVSSRKSDNKLDYFAYEEELVGYLGLYRFGKKFELCGMVHPNHRKKGIFTRLFNQARQTFLDAEELLFNFPAASDSGKAFTESQPCQYAFTEFEMKCTQRTRSQPKEKILLLEAKNDDLSLIQKLDVLCFNLSEEDAYLMNQERMNTPENTLYTICYEDKKIGKVRLQRLSTETWIYGFAIHPEYQGKGIGRSVLTHIANSEGQDKSIHLEVEANNEHALRLYKDVGFEIVGEQAYYTFDLKTL
ncbi:GNAT family N-acetyltransferase [Cytobacillus purgationiresistens]|uniref:Ribosomal protein S18 acetylase RimI-like enzyme n=1 Tax=Cytobacillus purgationiresistens TaxID=863449 RepID=A0ABU0AGS9_9BACI|nr:GNAT family N-acetyltransferase [Cytobacillus purgationiresistens]MDQ0270466.1 ribosomal protein S18 acetylase RimI-like enzyme [Cytobacillus purgationiresistens]